MPAAKEGKEDERLKATHFRANHHLNAGSRGSTVTVEQLNRSFGKDATNSPEQHEEHLKSSLKRLLDLGAITPVEAPEEVDPAEAAEKAAKAEEEKREKDAADMRAAHASLSQPPAKAQQPAAEHKHPEPHKR